MKASQAWGWIYTHQPDRCHCIWGGVWGFVGAVKTELLTVNCGMEGDRSMHLCFWSVEWIKQVQLCLESSIKTVFLLLLIKMALNEFKSLFFLVGGRNFKRHYHYFITLCNDLESHETLAFFLLGIFSSYPPPLPLCSFFPVFLSSLLHVRLSLQTINPPACSFNLHITLPLTIINKIATHT